MDENDGHPENRQNSYQSQETFQGAQETQVEHRFPSTTGIVSVPRGSRGPRSLYLKRHVDGFGFTLRHFILYPPDSIAEECDGRHAAVGALNAPMDTIFVINVRDPSPAKEAGLQQGDRLVAVNNIPVTSYTEAVKLIVQSPEYLHLLIVPKEEDVIQRFYPKIAYNPASNQQGFPDYPCDKQTAQKILTQRLARDPNEIQIDAISWRSLQQPYTQSELNSLRPTVYESSQHSAENLLYSEPRQRQNQIYAEINPHDITYRKTSRAAPQVPLYKKMGRRASEGSYFSEYEPIDYSTINTTDSEDINMKAIYKSNYLSECADTAGINYQNPNGCRVNMDASRRESTSSLSSSIADGSKDSLASYDSASTLTGHETDDSAIMTRFRQSVKQKEEFLKMPTNTTEPIRKGFYIKPKKLERQIWPPNERESSSRTNKPIHQNFQRVKNDIEHERDLTTQNQNNENIGGGTAAYSMPQQYLATSPKEKLYYDHGRMHEAETAPETYHSLEMMNGTIYEDNLMDDRRYPLGPQLVQKRAKEFESGRPLPENDPVPLNRMNFSRSELARLSSKKLVPNVCERAQEYETRVEPRRDPVRDFVTPPNTGPTIVKRIQRDSRSLDSSDVSGNEATKMRARSNSADSWVGDLGGNNYRISRQDTVIDRSKLRVDDKPVVVKRRPKNTNLTEDDRAVRRASYLKATEVGPVHFDNGHRDGGEVSPQMLKSSSASSSSASLDREKAFASSLDKPFSVIREGYLHCKILELDGKRFGDRSWKQSFVVLKGPKLYLNKSPVGTDSLDQSLVTGVDMRTSVVRVAEDYTKRKNVLRVSAVQPCRSEFLLQAETTEEFADWVKTLQEQVAASTDAELAPTNSNQQAVPQSVPALTTVQVQGSHLSPQLNKSKATSSRNRSPTGQSPVSKSRKPSQVLEPPSTSPKSKTWRGRMVRQFKKFNQGANSPSSPTAPEGSTFGIPIEDCIPSSTNPYVPRFVEICTDIIDERGLQTIGIYRVPGNNASITALTEEVNKNYDDVPLEDPRWNDLHVVSSLLKSFFRKMPDSLITIQSYPSFIKADKIENPKIRMEELRKLVRNLPKYNYHTLKHIIYHLKRVADNSTVNKMEAKNLAIVFGPTIVRTEGENMESIVTDMTNQCKIVETLLLHVDWFFPENENEENMPVPVLTSDDTEESESNINRALLLHNISKYEALKDSKEKNVALFSSIISAAQRKVKRKPNKPSNSLSESKDEPSSPTNLKVFPTQSFSTSDIKESSSTDCKSPEPIPTTVKDIENKNKPADKVPWFNYSTDKDEFHRRIENFRQETEAMLQRPRKTEILVNIDSRPIGHFSSSAGNVNQNTRLSMMKPKDLHVLTKTHSASNVFTRGRNVDSARNSLNSVDSGAFSMQYVHDKSDDDRLGFGTGRDVQKGAAFSEVTDGVLSDKRTSKCTVRRVGSIDNVNSVSVGVTNGNLKKVKYENESGIQKTGSLDSLNKLQNEDDSLLSTMTKLIDEKLKEEHSLPLAIASEDIPFVDESPEKQPINKKIPYAGKENIPQASDLYRNPSLHKNQYSASKSNKKEEKEQKLEKEKEEDTLATANVPDNEKHINKLTLISSTNKLKRSESLNKPDRSTVSLNKVKRSESLNKAENKLKRSDSLTKWEKTESNINKRREFSLSNKRLKDCTKNKRKNGMPDRSIKRRHTVGGTKDLENIKDTNLRTSSPDLSSARRENIFFEINLICPENMVVALKKHLIGTRPQSFTESPVYKVPLESHV